MSDTVSKSLEQKLEQFLKDNNRQYYKDSIKYKGLRNIGVDDSVRTCHIVSYMVSISDQPYDGDAFFYASFDEKEHHLVDIIGPQSYEKIEK